MADSTLTDSLKKYFSHNGFRKPQDDIINSILSGKDTLAIMPTGGGKSLCYQLPAMMLDGVAIVVSPLIALMKDQVDALLAKGIPAVMINSSQTWEAQSQALDMLANGEVKLAYVAPERFRVGSFIRALRNVKISLFAIDEAHCISQWGHDFRPDYMKLGETLEKLGNPTCAAFTATATPDVKRDILTQLNLKEPNVFVSGFSRPNLSFNVREVSTKAEKISRIKELIEEYQTGIIYCATRKSVDALSEALFKDGVRHIIYHAAMTPTQRDKAQEAFISKKENIAIATNAFGMGIDRADIRFVCHYELTGSIEALYQESGRAGRDGLPSYCEMLLMYADKRVQEFFIEGANPDVDFIRTTYRVIKENSGNSHECVMPIDAMAEEIGDIVKFERQLNNNRFSKGAKKSSSATNSMAVSSSISILRKHGYIDRFDVAGSRARGTRLLDPDIEHYQITFPIGMIEEKRNRDETKLRDVLRYAYSKECRQQWILDYFGDDKNQPCNNCDICKTQPDLLNDVDYLTDEERTILIKALSSVARMSVKIAPRIWQPRFGRDRIIKCMCGSKDDKIISTGLDKLSTYGILKEHGSKFCTKLIASALDAGFIETVDGIYPLTGLTERGVRIMLGEDTNIKFRFPKNESKVLKPKKSKKTNQPHEDLSQDDYTIYHALVRLRARICMQRGGIPSYLIFSNDVLIQMAKNKPKTMEEGMQIKGIGAINSKKYLKQFIEVLKKY